MLCHAVLPYPLEDLISDPRLCRTMPCSAMLCCVVLIQFVPLDEGRYAITPELARELIDENTIGVVGILGSTYNGEFEDIKGLNDMVGEWLSPLVLRLRLLLLVLLLALLLVLVWLRTVCAGVALQAAV